MSLFFAAAALAAMQGDSLTLAILGRFAFPAAEKRYWLGRGIIELGGESWLGTGELVSLSALTQSMQDIAVPITFKLSGVDDEIAALAAAEANEIKGRAVTLYMQFFGSDLKPLDTPAAIWSGSMDRLEFDGAVDAQSFTLVCEGLFTNRSKAPFSLLTDLDQRKLYPGDKGLQHVAGLQEKLISWP